MRIEQASIGDLDNIASIHRRAFPAHFLTQLGRPFLRRYYRLVLEYSRGLLLVSRDVEGVAGFVSGFVDPVAFYSLMRSKRLSLGMRIILPMLRSPRLVGRFLENRQRVGKIAAPDSGSSNLAELSSLAVAPEKQARGLGRDLVDAFCRKAADTGAATVYLTTDAKGNDRVNQFYIQLGFADEPYEDAPARRPMIKYSKRCKEDCS